MDSRKIKLKRTTKFGKGVFAVHKIRKGERIASFDGPFYTGDDEWTDDMYHHAVQCGPDQWRDSKGLARYMNHSCEPNCGIKNLFDVVAMRTIHPGEHLTWDYEMTERNRYWRMKCKCGSTDCRKVIGDYRRLPARLRRRYRGYISSWLTRRR